MSEDDTVVVTGGLGGVGRWVLDTLCGNGWNVACIDLETPPGDTRNQKIDFWAADLTDQGEAWELISEIDPDAVVHLAAIPRVGVRSGTVTFETNVTSTYNVLNAAGEVGARIVNASSNSTFGQVFAAEIPLPEYFPIDESHPLRPEDAYGTSKVVGEEIAAMVTRRYGVPVVSLRPPLVQHPGEYRTGEIREQFDPETAAPDGGYWSYVDSRDVAAAVRAALTAEVSGHEPVLVAAENNYLDRDTEAVVESVFGELPTPSNLSGDESVYDLSKARDLLGWAPEHTWQTAETAAVTRPLFGDE